MFIPITGAKLQLQGFDRDTSLTLEERLGSGAFGDVFKGRGGASKNVFAVKFPKLAFSDSREMAAFYNEIQAAQKIQHPNVVQMLFANTDFSETPPCLVMEFIEGNTLASCLAAYRNSQELVPLQLLQTWSQQLFEGMAAINAEILHRDLKPDNILIEEGTDTLKITDFGLSKLISAVTRTNTFKGGQHIYFMAPEGWKLETNDIQIDMYAVGIILFEVASLDYPYELPQRSFDLDAIREMHLFQPPKSLSELRTDLPVEFYHLVTRLMEKRPQDRYANWDEAKNALAKAWEVRQPGNRQDEATAITALLEQTARLHQIETAKRLEREKRAVARREELQIQAYQRDKLVERFRELVEEFNERSSLGKISEQPSYIFVLPYGSSSTASTVHFDFFEVDPPMNLERGPVRFAATLYDSGLPRLNYLLCQHDETDLYGVWVACEAWNNALVKPEKRHLSPFEPFGFRIHEIHQIEVSARAMHVFRVEFSDDIKGSFLKALSESMDRSRQ